MEEVSNEVVNEVVNNVVMNELELLTAIHSQLGVFTSFILFFIVVILCYFSYKFFNMFF